MPKKTYPIKNSLTLLVPLLGTVLILILTGININSYMSTPQRQVLGETTNPNNERVFWQEILSTSPTYYEAWVKLSEVESDIGNATAAAYAKTRAKQIKPNSF